MGKIRKMLMLAGALALLPLAPAHAQQCQLKIMASLDMVENPYGVILIPVTIMDTPRVMLLDTAGFSGSISDDVADELKLTHRTLSPTALIYTASGQKYEHYVVLPSIAFGHATAENVEFLLTTRSKDADKTVAGVIAPDLLRNFDVDLDFAKKKVNLFSPDHCEGQVVYWARHYISVPIKVSSGGTITMETSVDGHEMDTVFDTGTTYSTLSLPIAQRVLGVDIASPNVQHFGEGTSFPYYRTNFKSLSLEGLSVPNPTIDLIPDTIYEVAKRDVPDRERYIHEIRMPHIPELILGMDVIHQLHVYIAYQEHKLYITSAGGQ